MLKRLFFGGKIEQEVIEKIKRHIKILCSACETFKTAIEKRDKKMMLGVFDLEREGDIIRRKIISNIYEGAFLPFLRPSICKLVEIVDDTIDLVEDAAFEYTDSELDNETKEDCIKIADMNLKMCEIFLIAFESLLKGEDLREKNLAIRIYEKKIDEIKFDLIKRLKTKEVKSFWEGKMISDFIYHLTNISDLIEDASDYLQIINVSLR
ncbi:MAG: TIGR00153 family protein [Deltaproteobacteria bacterium]|nr:TIGR00153 family protein [Deltaproteobacteria bacterium]